MSALRQSALLPCSPTYPRRGGTPPRWAQLLAASIGALALGACGSSAGGGGGAPGTYFPFDGGGAGDAVATGDGVSTGDTGGSTGTDTTAGATDGGCVAKTCASAAAVCGTLPDGCGGTLTCGTCPTGTNCGAGNTCSTAVCQNKTCQAVGAACGTATDGCGGTQSCGSCAANQACSANQCVCQPQSCAQLGATCGSVDDGCGGALNCGVCPTCDVGCPTGFNCSGVGVCAGGDLTQLKLNMVSVPISGLVTLNGAKPKFGQYCTASSSSKYLRVRFSEVKKGYSFEFTRACNSSPHDFTFEGSVFPGTYRVSVSGYNAAYADLPTTEQVLYDALKLSKATSGIALNVTTVPISGVVKLNGAKPAFGQYCTATSSSKYMRVRFDETTKGYSFEFTRSCNSSPHDFTFEGSVFPGTYPVTVSGYNPAYADLPTTLQILYDKLTLTKATSGILLNVTTVPVSGVVTLNGAKPQFGQYCTANSSSKYLRVHFTEVKKGYSFEFTRACSSSPHDFTFEGSVFPGTYRVTVSGYNAAYANLPTTQQVLYDELTLTKVTSGIQLNVTTVPLSGVVTLNGVKPKFGQYCTATSSSKYLRVRFDEVKKGYSFEFTRACNSSPHDFTFEGDVFPGTYRVSVSGYNAAYADLPTTLQTLYDDLTLTKATSGILLNVTTVPVSGVVTLNGAKPTFGQYCTANSSSKYLRVRFTEVKKGYSFEFTRACSSSPHDFTFEGSVFPGTYTVAVAGYNAAYANLPTTQQVLYDELTLTKATSGILLNVTTVAVAGWVTLNGATPKFGQYCTASSSSKYMRVRFSEVKKGYSFEFARSCNDTPHDFSFTGDVFPGTYRVTVSGYNPAYADLPTTQQIIIDQLEVK